VKKPEKGEGRGSQGSQEEGERKGTPVGNWPRPTAEALGL
jgi:hypothetical protein